MTKLGCIGDLHLGKGVATYGPQRLADQQGALEQAFRLFAAEGVDGVLISGDTWHGPVVPPEQYVAFAKALRILDGIPVVMVLGNGPHDLAVRETTALHVFKAAYPDARLSVRTEPDVVGVAGCSIVCLPWTKAVYRLAAASDGASRAEINDEVARHLIAIARDHRERVDGPAVLLGHWDVAGASLPNGLPVEIADTPMLGPDELVDLGYDAVILGHVHRSQQLFMNPDGRTSPAFGCYVGSPLALDHGEAGFEHGCWIVDPGVSAMFFPLSTRRFLTLHLGVEDEAVADVPAAVHADLGIAVGDPRVDGAIVRVLYTASEEQARRVDQRAIKQALYDAGAFHVAVKGEIVRADRARIAGLDESVSEVDAFEMWIASEQLDAATADVLRVRHAEILGRIA